MQGILDGSNLALAGTKLQTLSFFDLMVSNIGEECNRSARVCRTL